MKKFLALFLVAVLMVCAASCGATDPAPSTSAPEETSSAAPAESGSAAPVEEQPTPDSELSIRVMTLNGTTGFGMAQLMSQSAAGEAALNYNFSVETAAPTILSALINGTVDIAALPTNAAATVYNKTEGGVKICALNTLGVLYLLESGETVTDFASLAGKTVYVPGQGSNPEYVFSYLCAQNGLEIGKDIFVDYTYNEPADLRTAVASGAVELAVLPEPMVTIARSANADVRVALDLTEEWNRVAPQDSLVQGCVVVRTAFAEEHPVEVAAFLAEYEKSVQFAIDDPAAASEMIAAQGIFAQAAVAARALPNCNLCFFAGADMASRLDPFFAVLFEANPASVGGKLPDSGIYYVADSHNAQ